MKQKIKLTEQDLHNIIMESVNRVVRKRRINEIGDTKRGKYMLGRLAARNQKTDPFFRKRRELDNEIDKRIKPYYGDDEVNRDFYNGIASYGSISRSENEDEYYARRNEDFEILYKQFLWYVFRHDEAKRIVKEFTTDYLKYEDDYITYIDLRPIYKLIDKFESDYDLSLTEDQEKYIVHHLEADIDDDNCEWSL